MLGPSLSHAAGRRQGSLGTRIPRTPTVAPGPKARPDLAVQEGEKGKSEAPQALTACSLGRRVAVDLLGVAPLPHNTLVTARIRQVPACKAGHDYL